VYVFTYANVDVRAPLCPVRGFALSLVRVVRACIIYRLPTNSHSPLSCCHTPSLYAHEFAYTYMGMCVSVCVSVCVRARARAFIYIFIFFDPPKFWSSPLPTPMLCTVIIVLAIVGERIRVQGQRKVSESSSMTMCRLGQIVCKYKLFILSKLLSTRN
jgi:hypothetical protein